MQQIRPLFGCLAEWFVLWLWGVCCFGAEAREKAANDSKRLNCVKFHRAKVGYKEKGLHLQHLHAGEFSAWKAERGRVGIYIQIKAYHALCFFDRPRSPEKISTRLSKNRGNDDVAWVDYTIFSTSCEPVWAGAVVAPAYGGVLGLLSQIGRGWMKYVCITDQREVRSCSFQ